MQVPLQIAKAPEGVPSQCPGGNYSSTGILIIPPRDLPNQWTVSPNILSAKGTLDPMNLGRRCTVVDCWVKYRERIWICMI